MGEVLLLLVVALTVAAVVFGVTVLVSGKDPGLTPAEPDGRAVPLPGSRPLDESDVTGVRFDTALRGYRMAQVDSALRRAAYDIGYKSELISVLEAENAALRDGRTEDADALRRAREEAAATRPETEQAGDPSDLENVYWPDAVIWHNHDNRAQTVQQNMKVLVAMGRFVEQRQYVDRRIHVFDGGIVQQHVLKGVRVRDGEPVELHACVVVTVRDGRITRLDEYLDSGEVAKFWS